MPHSAIYQITVDGNDVSSNFNPVLISLQIRSDDEQNADELSIELDDSYGQILLPRAGASIEAAIGWSDSGAVASFQGTLDENHSTDAHKHHHHGHGGDHGRRDNVHSSGSRSSGRILTITAKSVDMRGKAKQRFEAHADNKSFGDVAQQWAQKAGLTAKVDNALGQIQRSYWSVGNESFLAWGARMARELGATFKVFGTTAVFVSRAGGSSVSGQALTGITGAWGVNLISWDIAPDLSRPAYGSFSTRYYDPVAAQWKKGKGKQSSGSGDSGQDSGDDAEHAEKYKKPDEDQADQQSDSNAAESKREKGVGSATIDGEPEAQCGASFLLTGTRPGADGTYLISSVTQSLSRGQGFLTTCGLRQPSGDAGTDSR